ncbi:MAG: lytic transglycosylase domain-containing protein [Tannerella sp.]|jgi:hypothetical protein|nr:lytic transglycosylase domain-containing protein [Tannerella sp.]
MKRNIIKAVGAAGIAGLIGLTACMMTGHRDSTAVVAETPVVASFTNSPPVPSSIRFCGKSIDLTRYNSYEGIDRELCGFAYLHSTTMMLIKRANRYFPVIEPILSANGIPDDFKYLAVIESSLDPTAVSTARAVGLWQLLEGTGKQYGLRITTTVDERRNVAKSTQAACKYLNEAYRKYGDWITVASSYNAGMGRITTQMDKQGVESSLDLYLLEETTRYPYRIFAVKLIFENPYKYGFIIHADNLYKPFEYQERTVNSDIPDLAAFAQENGVTFKDLKIFNPWLRDDKLLTDGASYTILIPKTNQMKYGGSPRYVHDERWVVQ